MTAGAVPVIAGAVPVIAGAVPVTAGAGVTIGVAAGEATGVAVSGAWPKDADHGIAASNNTPKKIPPRPFIMKKERCSNMRRFAIGRDKRARPLVCIPACPANLDSKA